MRSDNSLMPFDSSCRPSRVIIYAPTDWLRVATKLAQNPSPCAQYFVSVPPLAADKTQARAGQASQIRALGATFHALDEVSYTGWSGWVASGAGSWFDAGVSARQRMTAAGFDTAAGDTWTMNELSSAVRKGTSAARRNALDFLHGLASDGVKGVIFAAGVGQSTSDLSLYKVNLQNWLSDGPFWTEAASYTSDWAQENYGDLRNYAVAGASPAQRRDAILQYLGHEAALAAAGPDAVVPARALLAQTYVPFGNAAWAWSSSFGWTAAPVETMEDFVSGQVYADRTFAVATSATTDRIGFAWSPSNTLGLTTTDFNTQTAAVLDRIAAAIHDSAAPVSDPGAAACAPAWCSSVVDGAAFTSAWQPFASWSPALPVFASAPVTATAGTAGGPLTVELQTLGLPDTAGWDRTLTLGSSSPTGTFATSPAGPWTPTLTLSIPVGGSSVSFFYSDTNPGAPTITATLDGQATSGQTETITPAAPPPPAETPGPVTRHRRLRARRRDDPAAGPCRTRRCNEARQAAAEAEGELDPHVEAEQRPHRRLRPRASGIATRGRREGHDPHPPWLDHDCKRHSDNDVCRRRLVAERPRSTPRPLQRDSRRATRLAGRGGCRAGSRGAARVLGQPANDERREEEERRIDRCAAVETNRDRAAPPALPLEDCEFLLAARERITLAPLAGGPQRQFAAGPDQRAATSQYARTERPDRRPRSVDCRDVARPESRTGHPPRRPIRRRDSRRRHDASQAQGPDARQLVEPALTRDALQFEIDHRRNTLPRRTMGADAVARPPPSRSLRSDAHDRPETGDGRSDAPVGEVHRAVRTRGEAAREREAVEDRRR